MTAEIDAAGHDVLDVHFGAGNSSYRVLKAPPSAFDLNVLRASVH